MPQRCRGFTLLELSIVLIIISTVIGGAMAYFSFYLRTQSLKETEQKLQVIQETLKNYRLAFHRLPCPADITTVPSAAAFGVEVGTPGDGNCTGANFTTGAHLVKGMLPTKTLGLPDEMAFDGWGRRITYATDKRLTVTNAFFDIPPDSVDARITIRDGAGTVKTDYAAYAVISHGINGHGAYPRGSAAPLSYGTTNTDELQNCDCNNNGTSTGFNGIFVQKLRTGDTSVTEHFDDIVIFATRSDLRSSAE